MNVKLLITKNGEIFDLTNTVEKIKISTSLYDQAGECSFSLVDNSEYPNGSLVEVKIDGIGFFKGYVFKNSISESGITEITAYDQMRYLKNEDTIYYKGLTTAQIFSDICKRNELNHKIVNDNLYINLPYLYDKKSMFDIIKTATDENLRVTGLRYFCRDNFGTLEFLNVNTLKTDLIVGEKSICTGFEYEKSIDDNTYNVVKLYRDNKETEKRDYWQAQDGDNIKRWGKLQYTESVDENANEAQIKELAQNMLKVLNRETRKLDLSIIGFYNLKAGDGIKVELPGVNEWFFLKSIETTFSNDMCECDLEVFIP
jgi:hypothetical protein